MGTLMINLVATVCLVWSCVVVAVECIGMGAIFRYFSRKPPPALSPKLQQHAPHVTVIRPVKGLEPHLYECIASTFRQEYPVDRLSLRLCVDDRSDPAYPVLQQVVDDFPQFDAQVLIEADCSKEEMKGLGPNPKIRNISKAYREAQSDIVWMVDCNVWIPRGAAGRMVDKLMGYTKEGQVARKPYKFVHQMPLVVDIVQYGRSATQDSEALLSSASEASPGADPRQQPKDAGLLKQIQCQGGGRLDEMFMATTHAKFYGAINAVAVAPCIVGKSNMFRKSQLNQATDPARNPILPQDDIRPAGVDYFSYNICEDHCIGDILWRTDFPGYNNHGIVWGDLAVQPMAGMSVSAYVARRVRWLRARKWTVLAATLVEPGVESLLCGLAFAFATTTLKWFEATFGIPRTWSAMGAVWLIFVTAWMMADRAIHSKLHSAQSIDVDEHTPHFARGRFGPSKAHARPLYEWIPAWLGREILAMPIWTWAVLLGDTVNWRGSTFRVRFDTTVEELDAGASGDSRKSRRD